MSASRLSVPGLQEPDRSRRDGERRPAEPAPPASQVLALQRGAGNAAVAAMIARREDGMMGGAWSGIQAAGAAAVGALASLTELKIEASVGRGGKNEAVDVANVRARLQALGFPAVDEADGLAAAIERYQGEVVGLRRPDGRVDPGGRTVGALSSMKRAAPAADAGPKAGDAPAAGPAPGPSPPQAPPAPAAGGGPAAPPGPAAPAGPRGTLADPALDQLVATTAKPEVDAAAAKLALLEKKFKGMDRSGRNEETGTARDELVDGFHDLRGLIARIDGAGLEPKTAAALKAQFFRAMNAITPFYYQGNNIILEFDRVNKKTGKLEHVWNTCNITSLSMVLEALGKSAADYKYKSLIPPIAEVYTKDVDDRATGKVADRAGTAMSGLRLPDFVAMAAIVWKMGYKTGNRDEILAGGNLAFNSIPSAEAIITLAKDFGGKPKYGAFTLDPGNKKDTSQSALKKFGAGHSKQADTKAEAETSLHELEAKLEKESNPARRTKLEKEKAKLEAKVAGAGALSDAAVEKELPLQQYKETILSQIRPELDRGNEIVVGQHHHFVRLQSVDDEFIVKDDPGGFTRGNMRLTWEEARALGLFWHWISIG
jgi:hypothetical protein